MEVYFCTSNKGIKSSALKSFLILLTIIQLSFFSLSLANGKNKPDEKRINLVVTVFDSVQNNPIELVNLILKQNNEVVSINITNPSGVTIFHGLKPGRYELIAHYIGYLDKILPLYIDRNNDRVTLHLQQSTIGMKEVVVTGLKVINVSNFVDIKTGNPVFEGETYHAPPSTRMTTLIQENLTGAVRAPTGEVHIRGQHGEYTYYLDGIPIPLGVFGGLNEVVDPKVIKRITFYTGGFPAEYGGQSAAIMNIQNQVPVGRLHINLSSYAGSYLTSNSGNPDKNVDSFKALNSNGQSLSISNHINKFGYFFSTSRQETDRRIDQPVKTLFHDHGFDYFVYGKLDYLISNKDYLTTNLNYSRTQTQIPYDPLKGIKLDNQSSYNSFQTLSYYHTFSDQVNKESKLFVGIYAREGGLKYVSNLNDEPKLFLNNDSTTGYVIDQNRNFTTLGTRIKFSNRLSHHFAFAVGFSISSTTGSETFDFKNIQVKSLLNKNDFTGGDFGLFAQTILHPNEWCRLETGIRYDQHIAPNIALQKQFSPRIKLSFFPDQSNTIYLSYDRLFMPTNIEGLYSVAAQIGYSSQGTLAEKDNLYEFGIIHNFRMGLTAKADFFHKDASPGLDDETLGSSSIKVNVNINKVKISGIELSLSYSEPGNPFSGYVNGSLIHAYGRGPISGGFLPPDSSTQPFDLDHDQRASLVIGMNYQPKQWFANLVAMYGTGLANGNDSYNFKTGLFDFNQGAHTTPYWIFNVSAGYKFYLGNGHILEPSLYITNLLDHSHLLKGAFFSGASFEERRNVTLRISYDLF